MVRQAGHAIIYNDPRRFGYMDLMARSALADHPWFRSLGVEPTGNSLEAHELARRLAGKTAPLKAALLDQRIIAGLGNIYVCEAMWRAVFRQSSRRGDSSPRRASRARHWNG
jgi:formamidopyrimidine-DNA glycosylase